MCCFVTFVVLVSGCRIVFVGQFKVILNSSDHIIKLFCTSYNIYINMNAGTLFMLLLRPMPLYSHILFYYYSFQLHCVFLLTCLECSRRSSYLLQLTDVKL